MKGKFYFLTLLAIAVFFLARVQKQNNVWVFGQQAGIDFNDSNPALLHISITNNRSCASISGHARPLLFYTDEATTWNRNPISMPSGTVLNSEGLLRNLAIVPFINDTTRFYIFRPVTQLSDTTGALYSSVVNMSLTYLNTIIRSFIR